MSLNRPSGAELVAAVREFLEKEVAPQLKGATAFQMRIAGNVLAIVERELTQKGAAEATEAAGLIALLGEEAAGEQNIGALERRLVERIRAGDFDTPDARRELLVHLKASTAAKLAIDNPKYK